MVQLALDLEGDTQSHVGVGAPRIGAGRQRVLLHRVHHAVELQQLGTLGQMRVGRPGVHRRKAPHLDELVGACELQALRGPGPLLGAHALPIVHPARGTRVGQGYSRSRRSAAAQQRQRQDRRGSRDQTFSSLHLRSPG